MKKNITFLLFIIIALSAGAQAQTYSIKGQVIDKESNKGLPKATVLLIRLPDSSKTGIITDLNGNFLFPKVRPASYLIEVRFLGYETSTTPVTITNKSIDLKKIYLSPGSVSTEEVDIIAKIPPVVTKNDTSEFNADAFKINKDATGEDLVTKLPGVTVQNGTIQAQGENIKKVLVDGKQFFGDDPSAVLKNLPADIIEKIQVFDQQSDQAQFTGFDDGNSSKTLNIVTRTRIKDGTFGKLTGGYGNEDLYKASGNINMFNEDRRISLLAQSNNTNEQNFSPEDLLGVMSSSGQNRSGRRPQAGGPGGPGSSPGRGPDGGGASNFFVSSSNGITKTNALGLNFSDKWDKSIDFTGSYFFNYGDNNSLSDLHRNYFLGETNGQNYDQVTSSNSKNTNHRLNMRIQYQIDSSSTLLIQPKISLQKNDGYSNINGETFTESLAKLNSVDNLTSSNLTGISTSTDILYMHKFSTTGRTISIGMTGTYTKNSGDSKYYAENKYYGTTTTSNILDEKANLDKYGFSGNLNVVYTEPLSKTSLLQFNTKYYYSKDDNDLNIYDKPNGYNDYNFLDTALSNQNQKYYFTRSYGTGYLWQKDKSSALFSLNYNIANLKNDIVFPNTTNIQKTFYSFLPSFRARFAISKDQNLRINYQASNNAPSVDQLQNVLDNTNSIQLSIGNPLLKQDISHSISLRYSIMNFSNMQSLFVMMNGTFKNDYIGNDVFIASKDTVLLDNVSLKRGSQLSTYKNVNGYASLRSFIAYSIPFLSMNTNFNVGLNYTRTPGVINDLTNFTKSQSYNAGITLSSNISEKIDFTVSHSIIFNKIINNLQSSSNSNYTTQNSFLRLYWQAWLGIVIQTDVNYQHNNGLSSSYNTNSTIMNCSIGKKLFANDRGEIRFSALDIFDQKTNIQRTSTDSYYQDTRSNVLGRYFIVSFIYNLRSF
ncbi:MAG: TonB-dependent receptor [Bacteroidota bacterium]|nr:TonB-dependent receptor [Bacteroidota bacterium]